MKSLPQPLFSSDPDLPGERKLIAWLFRGDDLQNDISEICQREKLAERQQKFAKYCRALEAAAMVGQRTIAKACEEEKAQHLRQRDEATNALVKLFLLFERSSTTRLRQFQEIAPAAYFFCRQLRGTNLHRFKKAMSCKAGRSPRAHAIMLLCLMIEEEKANGKTTAQAVREAQARGRTKNLNPPAEERLRKYYNGFNRGLFAHDEISASRALWNLTRKTPSESVD